MPPSDIVQHHRRCRHRRVQCAHHGCRLRVPRKWKQEHESRCDFKRVQCRNQGCPHTCLRMELVEHEADCVFARIGRSELYQKRNHHWRNFTERCQHEGCVACIIREGLEEHEQECDYRIESCRNFIWGCPERVRRMDQPDHERNCSHRLVECRVCGEQVPLCEQDSHEEGCSHRMISCAYDGCVEMVPQGRLMEHQERCAFRPVQCRHRGCSTVLPQGQPEQQGKANSEGRAKANGQELVATSSSTASMGAEAASTTATTILEHEQTCKWQLWPCSYCGEQQAQWKLPRHSEQCDFRPVCCPFKGCGISVSLNSLHVHKRSCPQRPKAKPKPRPKPQVSSSTRFADSSAESSDSTVVSAHSASFNPTKKRSIVPPRTKPAAQAAATVGDALVAFRADPKFHAHFPALRTSASAPAGTVQNFLSGSSGGRGVVGPKLQKPERSHSQLAYQIQTRKQRESFKKQQPKKLGFGSSSRQRRF